VNNSDGEKRATKGRVSYEVVEEVLDQWYGPAGAFYKVRAQPLCPGAANVSAPRKLASRVSSVKARTLTVDMCLSLLGSVPVFCSESSQLLSPVVVH